MTGDLTAETLKKIDDYLTGKSAKAETWQWAVQTLSKHIFSAAEVLLEDAITALAGLHDEDERLNTAKGELLYYRDCLLGEVPYALAIEFPAKAIAEAGGDYKIEED